MLLFQRPFMYRLNNVTLVRIRSQATRLLHLIWSFNAEGTNYLCVHFSCLPLTLSLGFVNDIIAFPNTFPYMFTCDVLSTCRLCRSLLKWTGGATGFSVFAINIDVSANDAFDSGFALDILSPPLDIQDTLMKHTTLKNWKYCSCSKLQSYSIWPNLSAHHCQHI